MPLSWLDLLDDEEIIWRDHPSPLMLLPSAVFGVVLLVLYLSLLATGIIPGDISEYLLYSVIAIPAFFVPLGLTELKRRNIEYVITNQRVAKKSRIIARTGDPINASKIQNIQYDQGMLDRFLGIGELHIMTSGRGDVDMIWKSLRHPKSVSDLVSEQKQENI